MFLFLNHNCESALRSADPGDCNQNGVEDICEVDCGPTGGACDVPGCGASADCNGNLRPDQCDRRQDLLTTRLSSNIGAFDLVASQAPYPEGFLYAAWGLMHVSPDGQVSVLNDETSITALTFASEEFLGETTLIGVEFSSGEVFRFDFQGEGTLFAHLPSNQANSVVYVPAVAGGPAAGSLVAGSCSVPGDPGSDSGLLYAINSDGAIQILGNLPFCPYDLVVPPDSFGGSANHLLITPLEGTRVFRFDLQTLQLTVFFEITQGSQVGSLGAGFRRMDVSPVGWAGFLRPVLGDQRVLLVAHVFNSTNGSTIQLVDADGIRVGRMGNACIGAAHHSAWPRTPVFLPGGIVFVDGLSDQYGSGDLLFVDREVFVIGDCNNNGIPDDCDISGGAADCNGNGILESCEPLVDCNANQVQDACDIAWGTSMDSDGDGRPNECEIAIVGGQPPDGSIDARQPFVPEGGVSMGWRHVVLTMNMNLFVESVTAADFEITQSGGSLAPPSPVVFERLTASTGMLAFSRPLEPGSRTTIVHRGSQTGIRLGYLPGDVNGDGTANPNDILALVDSLNMTGPMRPIHQTDINRNGLAEPSDILRLIDLLNGAGPYDVYNGVSLPE